MQIAADNAIFGQTGPKVGSFDAGYGSSQMVRLIGEHLQREQHVCACTDTHVQLYYLHIYAYTNTSMHMCKHLHVTCTAATVSWGYG